MLIKNKAFTGRRPKLASQLLANEQASHAVDCRLTNGELRARKSQLNIQAKGRAGIVNTLAVYRDGGNRYFLEFNEVVSVIPSPIADDANNRLYISGMATGPRYTDNGLALSGGSVYPVNTRQLGVPSPISAPLITLGAEPDPSTYEPYDIEEPQYVSTYVTDDGQESAQSPLSTVGEVKPGQLVTLTVDSGPGAVDLNITHRRIYRTTPSGTIQLCNNLSYNDGTQHDGVDQVPVGVTSIEDKTLTADLGESLPTDGWLEPPNNLQGLTPFPGSVAVGFTGKEILFSEPNYPYAWPTAYGHTVDYEIVAIAVAGQSVVVGTTGLPYVFYGTSPSNMTPKQLSAEQACSSARGMVDMGEYILYASPDGLVMVQGQTATLETAEVIEPEDWREQYQPETIHAYLHDGKYVAFYGDTNGDGNGVGGFIYDPASKTISDLSWYATAGARDRKDDTLYLVVADNIMAFDKGATLTPYVWRSKEYITNEETFSCAEIKARSYNDLIFAYLINGVEVMRERVIDERPFRLPAGLVELSQFELTGTDTVKEISIASDMSEL
jgi:hypothetical protein